MDCFVRLLCGGWLIIEIDAAAVQFEIWLSDRLVFRKQARLRSVLAAVNADQHDCLRYLVETYLAFAMALPRIWYQQGHRHVLSVGLLCWLDLDGDSFSKIELTWV